MSLDIFQSTINWQYSSEDILASIHLSKSTQQARKTLPKGFFDRGAPSSLNYMRSTHLYQQLKTMPKGVLHNIFFDCCDDLDFYRNVVIDEPCIYVTKDYRSFRIGNANDAVNNHWISLREARKKCQNQEEFVKKIAKITLFSDQQINKVCKEQLNASSILPNKISNSATLLYSSVLFKKYTFHVLRKFYANGYQRIQFRAELIRLSNYDSQGNFISKLPYESFPRLFDEVLNDLQKQGINISVGFIFCLRKSKSQQQIETDLQRILNLKWNRTVGIDFIQEQDLYGSIEKYDRIVQKVLQNHPHVYINKVYHAGETKDFKSKNIEEAVKAGSVRIGHGLNINQRMDFLPFCKFICFEKCPLSNLLLGFTGDPRQSSAPILLGLGHSISINMGDSGKLGAEDSTPDFFVTSVSYDWSLKQIKLTIVHSINHSLQSKQQKKKTHQAFNIKWKEWIKSINVGASNPLNKHIRDHDVFTSTNNWSFSPQDEEANSKFQLIRHQELSRLPKSYYGKTTMSHLQHMRAGEMYKILKTIPKGVLHHDHIDCNQDEQFYLEHVMSDPIVYLSADKKSFKVGTKEQAEKQGWISFEQLRQEIPNQTKRVKLVSNLTMLSKEQLEVVAGVQHEFWIIFEEKIANFFPIIFTLHLFKKYVRHTLLKFIKNGYERVEFRALLCQLSEYDQKGNLLKVHDEGEYMKAFDEIYFEVLKQHPHFSAGFIFFGLKALSQQANFSILDKACSYNWQRHIGIDFVQQEDPFGSMQPYIRVGDRIVAKYANMNLKKAYHAGETKDHLNNNVELSVRSGAVRIGHGLNIVKKMGYLPQCKNVCFELNPISNLLTGGMADIRMSPAPILLGLGYPVSISSDDPGKFGYEDTTVDFYAAAICFNWTLKHLKLVAIHSINHAIVTQGQRINLIANFNKHWNQWILQFLQSEQRSQGLSNKKIHPSDRINFHHLSSRINYFERL